MSSAKKTNILELRSCRGVGGGPEKTILFSAKELDRREFNVSIAYLKSAVDPDFDLHERAHKLGVEDFITVEERFKFDVGALRRLLAILREREISILHAHCYKSDLYGLILSRFHPMKLVTTAHGPLASFRFFWSAKNWRVRYLYDQLDLRLLRYFDTVIMVSDTMRPIISKYGVDDRKLIWIKNAIDSRFFRRADQPDASLRSSLRIPAGASVIGAVGRLNGEKDYPNFLSAAKLLLEKNPNLRFVIAGKGELDGALRALTRDLGLADHVTFLGHLQDVRAVYELMDVYVLSSTREGLPNAVLEAMAMEVPIVATDVDGVREAVVSESEAVLVPPRDAKSLAAGIERVLADSRLAQRLARTARQKVEREFSFEARMRRVEGIYRSVVAR